MLTTIMLLRCKELFIGWHLRLLAVQMVMVVKPMSGVSLALSWKCGPVFGRGTEHLRSQSSSW